MCKLRSLFKADFLNNVFRLKLGSILHVYFISKKLRSINEVLLKHKKVYTFSFFPVFILHLYFFLGSSLKAYFYWASRI